MPRSVPAVLLAAVCLALSPDMAPGQETGASPQAETARLVAVLKSDGPVYDKAMACRRLSVIGDKNAVPALATLLADEKLATYARTALELIPPPEAGDALRNAVGRLDGDLLIGVVGSIGKRRDTQAIAALTALLDHKNPAVAKAAADSLGHIGNAETAGVLQKALASAGADRRPMVANACLICAQRLQKQGNQKPAVSLYQAVRKANLPQHVALAATCNEIVARGKDGLPLLVEQLQSKDRARFRVALQAARSLGAGARAALIAGFDRESAPRQALLILALRDIGGAEVLPVILKAAGDGPKEVRLAAMDSLAQLADPSAAPMLLRAVVEDDEDIIAAAQAALAVLKSDQIDAKIGDMLKADDPKTLKTAAELAGQRNLTAATPALLKLAGNSDAGVRLAAVESLGSTVGLAELPKLIALSLAPQTDDRQPAADEALQTACARLPKDGCTEKLAAAMEGAPVEKKVVLLDQIAAVGGAKALAAVVAAARSHDDALQDSASRLLGKWTTADAAPALLDLAKTLTADKYKIRALRGYIRIARQLDMSTEDRVQVCRTAISIAHRNDEKKLALETLGRIGSPDAAALAVSYLDTADLKRPAANAALSAVERFLQASPTEAETILKRVIAADPQSAGRAKSLLARARGLIESQGGESGFVSLFDGKTFEGWEGNLKMFRIEDGAIVAGTMKDRIPRNEFLCTKKTYGDFELRLQFKVIGQGANAGVQIRSQRIPNHHEVRGYQADLGNRWWGCLYDESRRRKVLAGPPPEKRGEPVRMGDWNDYRIRCEGKRIQLWINGVQTVDYTEPDPKIEATGIIGLQVHSGGPMEAWYRNIRIKEL